MDSPRSSSAKVPRATTSVGAGAGADSGVRAGGASPARARSEVGARRRADGLRDCLLGLADAADEAERVSDVFEPALDAVCAQLHVGRAAILLYDHPPRAGDDARGGLRFRAWRGLSDGYRAAVEGHSPWAPDDPHPRPVFLADVLAEPADPALVALRPALQAEAIRALAFIPLVERGQLLGKLMIYAGEPRVFDADDELLALTVAGHVARALGRVQLVHDERQARRQAERTARLQRVTAALSTAATVAEVADAIVLLGAQAVGARAGGMWLVRDDEPLAECVRWFGHDDGERFRVVPLTPPTRTPVARAIEDGAPLWLLGRRGLAEAFPALARATRLEEEVSIACLPLAALGRQLGALTFAFDGDHPIEPETRRFLIVLSSLGAQAVERARIFERERRARAAAEAAQRRTTLLLDASNLLASSIDYEQTLPALAHLVASRLATWCAIELGDQHEHRDLREPPAQGAPLRLRTLAVGHLDAARAEAIQLARREAPLASPAHGQARVLVTGVAERYEDVEVERAARPHDPHLARLAEAGVRSAIVVAMAARDRVFGTITLAAEAATFGPDDLELANQLGRRAGIAIDSALLYAEAQAATRAREEILAVVSHDLKNPLAVVLMTAESLLELAAPEGLAPMLHRHAERLRRSGQRMSRLIDDLVDFDAMRTGQLTLTLGPCPPEEIVSATIELARPIARARGLAIVTRSSIGMPPCACDKERVVQALVSLVANALKVTASGGEVLVDVTREGDEIVFAVEDRGPGIPAEELPMLFERTRRGEATPYKGSGLGLTIAKGLVDAHGGRIWAESHVGDGTRFAFALPLSRG